MALQVVPKNNLQKWVSMSNRLHINWGTVPSSVYDIVSYIDNEYYLKRQTQEMVLANALPEGVKVGCFDDYGDDFEVVGTGEAIPTEEEMERARKEREERLALRDYNEHDW